MNSKYRLLNTLFQRPLLPSNKYTCSSGIRFLQFRIKHDQISKTCPQSLLSSLSWSTNCKCNIRNHAPITSTSGISRYYASIPPSEPTPPENEQPEKKLSLYQRFKAMYRDYWYVLLPVHLVTSAAWFGGFYYMASSGVDIVDVLEQINVPDKVINPFRNGHTTTGYIAISYALYKIATPLRYTITLGGTTISINYLKKWGYIKPLPSTEKLKEMYEDRKEILKGKGQTLKDNMMQSFKPTEN